MKETKLRKTVTAIRKSVVRNPAKKLFFVSKSKVGPTGDETNTKQPLIFKGRNNNGRFHIKCAQFFYMTEMPVINLAEFPQ